MDPEKVQSKAQSIDEKSKELEEEIGFSFGSLLYIDGQIEKSLEFNSVVLNKLKENLSNLKNSSLPDNVVEPIIKEMNTQIEYVESEIRCAEKVRESVKKNAARYKEEIGW